MQQKIYKYYKERLIEISGRSRSLYSKKVTRTSSYDIGKILDADYPAIEDFVNFVWSGKRPSFHLIGSGAKDRICKNLKIADKVESQFINRRPMKKEEDKAEVMRRERLNRDESKKAIISQVNDLKILKREVENLARETGRYELFVGYPFVEGSIGRDIVIRAPLLLFPVTINIESETDVVLELKMNEQVQFNKVFLLAYAQHHKLNTDDMQLEYNMLGSKFKNVDSVIEYLRGFGFHMGYPQRKGMFGFDKVREPHLGDPITVKHYCVMGRFPLANAIYNDYRKLEKCKPTPAIKQLLESRFSQKIKKPDTSLYTINSLDFAQEDAIAKLNQNGNMVIYGPPGTGKSQTIVNIITDALCKNKRVLVVSQKKAALDVVYNRLGVLNNKAMYINDPEKDKAAFYARVKAIHLELLANNNGTNGYAAKFNSAKTTIENEISVLQTISDTLFSPTTFGPSLQQMYSESYIFGKNAMERTIYSKLCKSPQVLKLSHEELDNAIRVIKEKRKGDLYYKRLQVHQVNPLVDYIRTDLDIHKINTARLFINKLLKKRMVPFDYNKYPNARQLVAFYLENGLTDKRSLRPIIRTIAKIEHKSAKTIVSNFEAALEGVKVYVEEYSLLETILEKKGFAITIESILNGNSWYLRALLGALDNYIIVRDMNINMKELTSTELLILNFAYELTKDLKDFKEVIKKLMPARMYHELVAAEETYKTQLGKIMDYENIRDRIFSLKNEQKEIVKDICSHSHKKTYCDLYNSDPENKNFFYQITKQQNLWSVRRLMEVYGELMLTMFPCWLLSPENVSTIMPLQENLFDLILFDEASQVFIECTLPTIYRGRYIAVSGDGKQLRPTALFMRRYMGNDIEDLDLSTQAALEVESLLDLATSRYSSVNLNYHYRSSHEEFINFSNYAFYDCRLQIAPNTSRNEKTIERIKVAGRWIDRKNREEANEIIRLLKRIFKTRKANETIGIVTFNSEQEHYIEDLIDSECAVDPAFKNFVMAERNRKENGEDVSIFIKNIENVQGDERDIIIFSIGYANNEYGKVNAHFGPLNVEGGENRLNVAITRAKKKIYVVTSIEPEELNVENTKNMGPKIFKKYLQYVRAVSTGNSKEVGYILESFGQQTQIATEAPARNVSDEIKAELEKLGYAVEQNIGNNSYKLSLAIYDKKHDKYVVGIELDEAAYRSSSSVMERDVFRSKFMESRGWKIMRVWSRDWWLSPAKVLNSIDRVAKRRLDKLNNAR